jgi:hypothetical protein
MMFVHQLPTDDLDGVDKGSNGPFLEQTGRVHSQAPKDYPSEVLGQKRSMPGKQKQFNRHQHSI